MKRNTKFGFTLVELLIVIALIGILAGAIVATLNPVEQVNKARDARYDNETAELLAGIERYYASLQEYPWQKLRGGEETLTVDSEFGAHSVMYGVGICAPDTAPDTDEEWALYAPDGVPTDCSHNGLLIQAQEVKTAFKNKSQFVPPSADEDYADLIYIYKEQGAGGSVYACFVPLSKTNRQNGDRLRCLNTQNGIPQGYAKNGDDPCLAPATDAEVWSENVHNSGDNAIFFCVPE